jgi:hypothetical protein
MDGKEYQGELCADKKKAEFAAATVALKENTAEILVLNEGAEPISAPKEREFQPAKKQKLFTEDGKGPAMSAMEKALSKMLKRPITPEDIFYLTEESDGSFSSVLAIPCLPGKLATETWAGDTLSAKPNAEESAALKALMALTEDEEHGDQFKDACTQVWTSMMKGKGKGSMMMMMFGCMKGMMKGGGKGKGRGPKKEAGERKKVEGTGQLTGSVVEWKGSFGWITANDKIDHPDATKNGGKVYVQAKDLTGEKKELEVGAAVTFTL